MVCITFACPTKLPSTVRTLMMVLVATGRWKVLHYIAKDIYQPIIISPFYNSTTGSLTIYVTSDLWSPVTGLAQFQWYDWSGNPIANINSPPTVNFTVGGLNTTLVYATTLNNSTLDFTNALLYMNITATGQLPNSDSNTTFTHTNYFHPSPLSSAQLGDPGLQLTYNNSTQRFIVEATTGIAIWTWLDYPAGALVNFDDNGFLMLKGEKREVGYAVKSDTSGGKWVDGVTVGSLWENLVG